MERRLGPIGPSRSALGGPGVNALGKKEFWPIFVTHCESMRII